MGSREHTKCSITQTNSHDGTQQRIRFQITTVFAKMPGNIHIHIYKEKERKRERKDRLLSTSRASDTEPYLLTSSPRSSPSATSQLAAAAAVAACSTLWTLLFLSVCPTAAVKKCHLWQPTGVFSLCLSFI